ncbi:reverse transcriptase domain-containing protein [Tanacetum coccineum]
MLRRDRRAYTRTARLMETEARLSREAWVKSMDASDTASFEVRALRTTVLAQQMDITQETALQSQLGPASCPAQPEIPKEAGSTDVVSYNQCFQELALMCARMFPKESDKIEKYVSGLPDMIHESLMASKPKTMQDAIEFATELMDKKIRTFAERQSKNKRKNLMEDLNLCAQNVTITMMVNVLQNATSATELAIWPVIGHFKRDCPKLKNNNRGNHSGNGNALAKVYAVGRAGTNQDSNVVTGTFLLNNSYASVLFDTGADRSFVSTAFSSQIDITPSALDHYYDVELGDGRIIGLNTILRGCTLNFLNHTFNIDLMPVELGSLKFIIGMDWLAKYQAVIVCAEKIIRIPWGNKTLIVRGDGSDRGNETRLNIISCNKTQKYMLKGCPIFLAHVTTKETEDKSKKKRLEDVPIVQNFPKVFPEDCMFIGFDDRVCKPYLDKF